MQPAETVLGVIRERGRKGLRIEPPKPQDGLF